ncbi:hypothetical protein [Taklimakanibacter lacteus]|uniref:hypothetical protein n=1 Tax=Taklimakanibacter lacteus TaxID=2268456 RepID=UPI0013C52FFE
MTVTRAAVLVSTFAGMLSLLALIHMPAPAEAARPSHKQAMAICRSHYGKDITGVVIKKNGQIVCQEGPGAEASRKEVFEWCKRKFSATTVVVQKKGKRWHCLYYGRY